MLYVTVDRQFECLLTEAYVCQKCSLVHFRISMAGAKGKIDESAYLISDMVLTEIEEGPQVDVLRS